MITDQAFEDANTSNSDESSSEESSLQTTVDGFDLSEIDRLVRSNAFPLLDAQAAKLEWEHIPTNILTSQDRTRLLNQLRAVQREIRELTTIVTSNSKKPKEHLQRFFEQLNQKKSEGATLIDQLHAPALIVRDLLKRECLVPLTLALYKIKTLYERKRKYLQEPRPADALSPQQFTQHLNAMLALIEHIVNRDPQNTEHYTVTYYPGENFPLLRIESDDDSVALRPAFLPAPQLQAKLSLAHAYSVELQRDRNQQRANLSTESTSLLAKRYALKALVIGHQSNPNSPLKDIFTTGQLDGFICLEFLEFLDGLSLKQKCRLIHQGRFESVQTNTNSVSTARTILGNMARSREIFPDLEISDDSFPHQKSTLQKIICFSESLNDFMQILNGVIALARHNIAVTDIKVLNFIFRRAILKLTDQKSVIGPFASDLSQIKVTHAVIEFLTTEAYLNEPKTLCQLTLQNLLSMLFVMLCDIDPPPQLATQNLSGHSGADFAAVIQQLKQDYGNTAAPAMADLMTFFEQPGVLTGTPGTDSQTASTSTSSTATNSQTHPGRPPSAVVQLEGLLKVCRAASTLLASYIPYDLSNESSEEHAGYDSALTSGNIEDLNVSSTLRPSFGGTL